MKKKLEFPQCPASFSAFGTGIRSRSLRFAVVFLFCLMLAAGSARAQEGQLPSDAQPVTGGHLIMGSIGEPSNLIPYLASDSASAEVAGLLNPSPLEYDKDFNIV